MTSESSLTLEVTLNQFDSTLIEAMAKDDYRTPSQQVGWIVSQWLKGQARPVPAVARLAAANGYATPPQAPTLISSAPIEEPTDLLPIYHVGDGSAGSGCGKVGLLAVRRLAGIVRPGDVYHVDKAGGPCIHDHRTDERYEGALTCCQCGGVMSPATWSYSGDDEPERPSTSRATMAKMMVAPGA